MDRSPQKNSRVWNKVFAQIGQSTNKKYYFKYRLKTEWVKIHKNITHRWCTYLSVHYTSTFSWLRTHLWTVTPVRFSASGTCTEPQEAHTHRSSRVGMCGCRCPHFVAFTSWIWASLSCKEPRVIWQWNTECTHLFEAALWSSLSQRAAVGGVLAKWLASSLSLWSLLPAHCRSGPPGVGC